MSIEPTVLQKPAQEITSNAPKQHPLKPSEIMALKICSALGALGFTAFMVNSWQMELAAYNADQASQSQAKTAQPAPAASTTSPEMTVVSTSTTTQETATETPTEPVLMTSEPSITDQKVLAQLSQKLYEKIDTNWKQSPTFSKSLVYQVQVAKDGDIAEYESLNPMASEYEKETPLPLLTNTQQTEANSASPLAKFLVVMTPSGVLEVSPWTAEQ